MERRSKIAAVCILEGYPRKQHFKFYHANTCSRAGTADKEVSESTLVEKVCVADERQ